VKSAFALEVNRPSGIKSGRLIETARGFREWMTFQPENTSGHRRIDTGLYPPCRFITAAMDLAMMAATKRYRELIATLWSSAQLLCKRRC
jgi:hypothetical protein